MSQNVDEDAENVAPTNDSTSWGLLFWTSNRDLETERLRHGKDLYKVGRGVVNDIIICQENCRINIHNLSRVHCGFKRIKDVTADYQTIIEDYSANGTFVNGVKIGKGKNKLLTHGDEISMTCSKGKVFIYLDTQHRNPGFPADINKKFVIVENLGKGSFGEVWLAVHKRSNKKYAIKSVRHQTNCYNEAKRADAVQQLKNESDLLCTLEHPGIVKVEDSICKTKSIHLVLELMNGGDLQKRIKSVTQIKESTGKYYFFQLLLAVQYLHKQGIVHRDLKPENILMSSQDDNAILKISDFGLSKFVDEETVCKTYCGTPLYLAPEVICNRTINRPYTSAVDVWSLGVILFLLLSGYHPFIHSYPAEDNIVKGAYLLRKERWSKVTSEGLALVRKMLEVNPIQRPTLEAIIEDPWMMDDEVISKVYELIFANSDFDTLPMPFASLKENETNDEPRCKRQRVVSL